VLSWIVSGVSFDGTVTLGNVLTVLGFLLISIIAWRDVVWRIKNLEEWRKEFLIDALSREKLESELKSINAKLDSRSRR